VTEARTPKQRERTAKRSLGEARGHREKALTWAEASAEAFAGPLTTSEQSVREGMKALIAGRIRAAIGHEVWAEYLLGRLTWDEYPVAEKLLPTWQGESLADFLAAIRAVSA
jgi:hypothetical protein